ncbi:YezD family protein [Propionispira raffinosivorans]|uniref:YezD family protein n=1 Tax=Propionispira raffinosivorans TaxID=86959 RepID=UPI00037D3481|nr:YezD family protein [Propionispira raffinosivorans]
MAVRKIQIGTNPNSAISKHLMEQIVDVLKTTFHGNVTLVTQNFRLVQIERNEKIRPCDMITRDQKLNVEKKSDYTQIGKKIQKEFGDLEYGQIVIVIKEGKIIQIERTEKHRFQEFTGLDGEGI